MVNISGYTAQNCKVYTHQLYMEILAAVYIILMGQKKVSLA